MHSAHSYAHKQFHDAKILVLAEQFPHANNPLLQKQIIEILKNEYTVHIHTATVSTIKNTSRSLSPLILPLIFTDMSFLPLESYDIAWIISKTEENKLFSLKYGFKPSISIIKSFEQQSPFCILCHFGICKPEACSLIEANMSESTTLDTQQPTKLIEVPGIPFDGYGFGCNENCTKLVNSFTTKFNTHIAILENQETATRFLVKQRTQEKPFWRLGAACDKLGSHVAQTAYVPVNRVEIIPAGFDFLGKRITSLPATLHNYVPGVMVEEMDPAYHTFQGTIRQSIKPSKSTTEKGLTLQVIKSMAIHQDLCKIVALDTFIANPDRHRANFFYDKIGDHYCAIDLEYSFSLNLGSLACKTIQSILDDQSILLTPKMIQGLKIYRTVLKQLLAAFSAKTLFDLLTQYANDSNAYMGISESTLAEEVEPYRTTIAENYSACEQLVILLDEVIGQHKKSKS